MGGCASSSASVDAVLTKTPDGQWIPKHSANRKQLKPSSTEQLSKPSGHQPIRPTKTFLISPCSNTTNAASSTAAQIPESTECSLDTDTFMVMTIPLLIDETDDTTTEAAAASARKQRIASYLQKAPDCSFYTSTKALPQDYIVESEEAVSAFDHMGDLESNRICSNSKRAPDCSFYSSKKAVPPAYISDSAVGSHE